MSYPLDLPDWFQDPRLTNLSSLSREERITFLQNRLIALERLDPDALDGQLFPPSVSPGGVVGGNNPGSALDNSMTYFNPKLLAEIRSVKEQLDVSINLEEVESRAVNISCAMGRFSSHIYQNVEIEQPTQSSKSKM
jgi:hypothetical protein